MLFDGQAISFPNVQFHPRQDSALAAGDALSNITSLDQMNVLKSQNANIYLCFQSIFKVQPSFDHVLIDILQADHNGRVVLQASRYSIQTSRLQMRLKTVLKQRFCGDHLIECSAMADAYSRIHFISRVRSDQVIELMQLSDVVLHPFPFGGSKTASDAIKAGVSKNQKER